MRDGDTTPITRAVTIAGSGDVDSAIRAYIQQLVLGERTDRPHEFGRPYFAFPYGLAADDSGCAVVTDPPQVDVDHEFVAIVNSVSDPAAFAGRSRWSPYEITFQQSDLTLFTDRPATLSLLSTRGRESEHTVLAELAVAGTRISFEMTRFVIDRSWFVPLPLSSRNWKWAISARADPTGGYPLSTGQPECTGTLMMVPWEILFIRNKRIENPALSRRLAAQPTIDHTASLFFGPFGLQPPSDDGRGTDHRVASAESGSPTIVTFDLRAPSTVVAKHMECLAFFGELLPRTPHPNGCPGSATHDNCR